jgi:nucleoside-diphosphate-sugar epimerase
MARRPYDPAADGLRKVTFRQGDVTDRNDVDALVQGADAVVHLAFVIVAGSDHSAQVNLDGSRNVFQAAVMAGAKRLVYASSVAAYGFHEDNPSPLTEDVPTRGSERHPYSHHKAAVEALLREQTAGQSIDTYVFRPCIVAGPDALMLIEEMPYIRIGNRLPGALRALFDSVPILKPVLPDPGVPFQLVHHDDVATALRAAVLGRGPAGVYNLAGAGEVTMSDLADELHWYSVPVPELAVDAVAEVVARLPFVPDEAKWIEAVRTPVLMSTAKARRELRWRPRHDARETLHETVVAARTDLEA